MEINRSSVVISAAPGDTARRRRLSFVQSDLFNGTHLSVMVYLMTTHLEVAPLFRIPVPAGRMTGLKVESRVMVDKVLRSRGARSRGDGVLAAGPPKEVHNALRLWLEFEVSPGLSRRLTSFMETETGWDGHLLRPEDRGFLNERRLAFDEYRGAANRPSPGRRLSPKGTKPAVSFP